MFLNSIKGRLWFINRYYLHCWIENLYNLKKIKKEKEIDDTFWTAFKECTIFNFESEQKKG